MQKAPFFISLGLQSRVINRAYFVFFLIGKAQSTGTSWIMIQVYIKTKCSANS